MPFDPLILNFGAATTTLTDKQFMFDINGDGQQEQLAQLGQGSGFLVFDEIRTAPSMTAQRCLD